MSTYIPPIDDPEEIYPLRILRYDPDGDGARHWETFQIPWVPAMTVMQALEWLWDQGQYVAFRANCREFTCGSCAMRINGRQGLACDTLLTNHTKLEPLERYPVKKDLIVDTHAVREKWRALELWPNTERSQPLREVSKSALEGWHRTYSRCIECYACLDACPASESDVGEFAGPMWMLQIARARAHPLDGADRLDQAIGEGIGRCVTCYECAEVCPVSISPVSEIQVLRRDVLMNRLKRWVSKLRLREA